MSQILEHRPSSRSTLSEVSRALRVDRTSSRPGGLFQPQEAVVTNTAIICPESRDGGAPRPPKNPRLAQRAEVPALPTWARIFATCSSRTFPIGPVAAEAARLRRGSSARCGCPGECATSGLEHDRVTAALPDLHRGHLHRPPCREAREPRGMIPPRRRGWPRRGSGARPPWSSLPSVSRPASPRHTRGARWASPVRLGPARGLEAVADPEHRDAEIQDTSSRLEHRRRERCSGPPRARSFGARFWISSRFIRGSTTSA